MAKRKLLDEIMRRLPKRGFTPWHEKLDPAMRAEIEQIKADFHSGRLAATKTGLAMAISATMREAGVEIGRAGVTRWLENH